MIQTNKTYKKINNPERTEVSNERRKTYNLAVKLLSCILVQRKLILDDWIAVKTLPKVVLQQKIKNDLCCCIILSYCYSVSMSLPANGLMLMTAAGDIFSIC
jgi:hypothetical protein